jgi:hypothetical protein
MRSAREAAQLHGSAWRRSAPSHRRLEQRRRQASGACAPSRLTGRRPARRPRRDIRVRRCTRRVRRSFAAWGAVLRAPPGPTVQAQCRRKGHGTHLGGRHSLTGWHAWVERMGEARAEQRLVTSSRASTAAFHLRRHLPRLESACAHGANICARYPTQPCTPARATQHRQARTLNAHTRAHAHIHTYTHTHTFGK